MKRFYLLSLLILLMVGWWGQPALSTAPDAPAIAIADAESSDWDDPIDG